MVPNQIEGPSQRPISRPAEDTTSLSRLQRKAERGAENEAVRRLRGARHS